MKKSGWGYGLGGLAWTALACSPEAAERPPPAHAAAPATAPEPEAPPAPPRPPPVKDPGPADAPRTVAFIGDGTLVVAGDRSLLAWSPRGSTKKIALPEGQPTVVVSAAHAGVTVTLPNRVLLFQTPELTLAHEGEGTALSDVPAVHLESERVVLVQAGPKIVRLDTRNTPQGSTVETVVPLLDGKRFSMTFVRAASDGSDQASALLYDAETASVMGAGLPFRLYPVSAPHAAARGKLGFSIEKAEVSRWDLEKGTILRHATVRCGGDRELGNPTPSPNGDLLVVTCGDDLIVLDGKTLKSRRRVARVVPGCDQGPLLGGRVLPDNKTLELEGCGGIAKLDLGTGKYACGDSAGVMGAPYLDGPPAPGSPAGLPPGRTRVPACSKSADEQAYRLTASGQYKLVYGERTKILHESSSFELEPDASTPVVSPDESFVAYARTDHVVVRSLPDGKVKTLLRLDAP